MRLPPATLLLILALACSSAPAQVGKTTETTHDAADLTSALLDPAIWQGKDLPGTWRDISTIAAHASRELTTLGPVFGALPETVQAYSEDGKLSRIEIVWLEAGSFFGFKESKELSYHEGDGTDRAKQQHDTLQARREEIRTEGGKRKEFDAKFAEYNQALPAAIMRLTKTPGRNTSLGQTGALAIPVTEWTIGDTVLRYQTQAHQLISLTILPKSEANRRLAAATSGSDRKKQIAGSVHDLPNGDTVISGVPMFNQGDRGYCAMGTLAMLTEYYGLSLNID
ncbi:MAG TPA: hypothetical protein VGH90_14045 [Chthoniobacteraceae bacterium]|jgi:hypothetical protein